jgi:hypothetical protein
MGKPTAELASSVPDTSVVSFSGSSPVVRSVRTWFTLAQHERALRRAAFAAQGLHSRRKVAIFRW